MDLNTVAGCCVSAAPSSYTETLSSIDFFFIKSFRLHIAHVTSTAPAATKRNSWTAYSFSQFSLASASVSNASISFISDKEISLKCLGLKFNSGKNDPWGRGEKDLPWYILLYNFLMIHPNFMRFGDFS